MDNEQFRAEELRELRARKNWSQQDLAKLLGVDVTTIVRWEKPSSVSRPSGTAALLVQLLVDVVVREVPLAVLTRTDGYRLYRVLHEHLASRPATTPTQEASLVSKALETLKHLFKDRPEVLRMFDLRELDLRELSSEELIVALRERKLYPEPVNLTATGRTGAGKTSLANCLLRGRPLPSTGRTDCTDLLQFVPLQSNLRYSDLPGAGSSEKFENINRAALLMPQLEDEKPVTAIPLLDFSDYVRSGRIPLREETRFVPLERWRSAEARRQFAPDIILYLITPHTKWLRDDRRYLRELLQSQRNQGHQGNIIFALNIHRNADGTVKHTAGEMQDVQEGITRIWHDFYPNEKPTIIEVDALKGSGILEITQAICRMLPPEKIGNMERTLNTDLAKVAKQERSRRFRQALIHVASRLATFKVDETIGRDSLLQETMTAVCEYGVRVFLEEDAIVQGQEELSRIAAQVAADARNSREEAVTIQVQDVAHDEVQETKVVGYEPEYEDVTVSEQRMAFREEERKMPRSRVDNLLTGAAEAVLHVLASPISIIQELFGFEKTANDEISEGFRNSYSISQTVMVPFAETVERTERRLKGIKQQTQEVTRLVPRAVTRTQEVGKRALQGGYQVVEDILSLGLAIEQWDAQQNLAEQFDPAVAKARQQIREKLGVLATRVDALAAGADPQHAEEEIARLLTVLFLN
jgi:transcriptional regulator with XRE-family HTH domain